MLQTSGGEQASALHGRNKPTCCVIFGTCQRRDTSVPPYGPYRQSVRGCRAAPVCAAGRCGVPMTGAFRRTRTPCANLPAGLRGLWPSHRNNAKHGLSALPHFFQRTAPNPIKIPTLKVLLDFFQKIAGVQGAAPPVAPRKARNPRPSQRAKLPQQTPFTAESTWSAAARRRETQR